MKVSPFRINGWTETIVERAISAFGSGLTVFVFRSQANRSNTVIVLPLLTKTILIGSNRAQSGAVARNIRNFLHHDMSR